MSGKMPAVHPLGQIQETIMNVRKIAATVMAAAFSLSTLGGGRIDVPR
jgi:hypothetical protein